MTMEDFSSTATTLGHRGFSPVAADTEKSCWSYDAGSDFHLLAPLTLHSYWFSGHTRTLKWSLCPELI